MGGSLDAAFCPCASHWIPQKRFHEMDLSLLNSREEPCLPALPDPGSPLMWPVLAPPLVPSIPAPLGRDAQLQTQHDGYVWPRMVKYLLSETDNFH